MWEEVGRYGNPLPREIKQGFQLGYVLTSYVIQGSALIIAEHPAQRYEPVRQKPQHPSNPSIILRFSHLTPSSIHIRHNHHPLSCVLRAPLSLSTRDEPVQRVILLERIRRQRRSSARGRTAEESEGG